MLKQIQHDSRIPESILSLYIVIFQFIKLSVLPEAIVAWLSYKIYLWSEPDRIQKIKKPFPYYRRETACIQLTARKGTRTLKAFRPYGPEPYASTSSATRAYVYGWDRIRTYVGQGPTVLQTVAFDRSATQPLGVI